MEPNPSTPAPAAPSPAPPPAATPTPAAPPATPKASTATHTAPKTPTTPAKTHSKAQPKDAGPRALSVVDALGLAPEKTGKTKVKGHAALVQERHTDGTFKKSLEAARAKANPPEPKPAKPAPVAPPPENEDDPAKAPVAAPEPKVPAAKVKIGDKEMTPEEVAAYVAELEKKAAPATPPPEPAKPEPKAGQTDAEKAAAAAEYQNLLRQERQNFLAERVQDFKPEEFGITVGEAELDTMLAGGPQGVQAFMAYTAKVVAAAEARAWERAYEAIHETRNALGEQLKPMTEREKAIAEWETNQSFFTEYEDLKDYAPQVENIRNIVREKYPAEWAAYTQKERNAEVAGHVRAQIAAWNKTPATPPAPTPPTVEPAKPAPVAPRPKPPTGHSPNGGAPSPAPARSRAASMLPEP